MRAVTTLLLARAGEGRISPIHFPISDFLLLFFHGVEKNWQEQRENDLGKQTITTILLTLIARGRG